jgi:hypothetical protein
MKEENDHKPSQNSKLKNPSRFQKEKLLEEKRVNTTPTILFPIFFLY